eukprot:363761_1
MIPNDDQNTSTEMYFNIYFMIGRNQSDVLKCKVSTTMHLCAYCHLNSASSRCGGCKLVYYCNVNCQSKHWKIIHKKQCKKIRKNKHYDIHDEYSALMKIKQPLMFKQIGISSQLMKDVSAMINLRAFNNQINQPKTELLFDFDKFDDQEKKEHMSHITMINSYMNIIISAYDKDGDKKFNFQEWSAMLNAISFTDKSLRDYNYGLYALWIQICTNFGLMHKYSPSLSNGIYGTYVNFNVDVSSQVTLDARGIMESLIWVVPFKERNKDLIHDEEMALKVAFKLLFKIYGHAETIVTAAEENKEDIYAAISDAIPIFDDDVISVIYGYCTIYNDVINIGDFCLKWCNLCTHVDTYESLWSSYDRDNQVEYDIFYLCKTHDCIQDIMIMYEICDGKACEDRINTVNDSPFVMIGGSVISTADRWCLGSTVASIPNRSFELKQIAEFIGKVLEFNRLDASLCHSIYIGLEVNVLFNEKPDIVKAYNSMYNANAIWRSR